VRAALGALAVVAALDARAEPLVLYTRATPLEARTGVVEIRTVQEAIADVPVDCAGAEPGSYGCSSEQRFARVYGLDLALERRDARGQTPRLDAEPRGQIYLLLHLERDDLAAFDEELRRGLAGLAADAFVDAFAGLAPGASVFARIAALTPEPSWSCFEDGASRSASRYERRVETGPDGKREIVGSGTTTSTVPALVDRLCQGGAALLRSARSEELRTMPSARALREETALVEFVDQIPDVARAEDLLALPEGFSYTVRRRPGVVTSASRHSRDAQVKATFTRDEVEIGAEVVPAVFPPHVVATRGWLASWTVSTLEREVGSRPRETRAQPVRLRTALVATLPPAPLDGEGRPTGGAPPETVEPRFDTEAYLGQIADRLDRAARLDAETLADAISRDPAGLASQGWILFVCRERSATFELLPTRAAQDIVNAGELCAALDRALARAGVE